MALTALKTWIAGEVLTASDLNSEFSRIYTGGESLGWPATTSKNLDGNVLILDDDGDSTFSVDAVDDRADLALQGSDLFRWDGTAASAVNGLTWVAAAAANPASIGITAFGSSDNISINLIPKGTGILSSGGTRILLLGDEQTEQSVLSIQVFW